MQEKVFYMLRIDLQDMGDLFLAHMEGIELRGWKFDKMRLGPYVQGTILPVGFFLLEDVFHHTLEDRRHRKCSPESFTQEPSGSWMWLSGQQILCALQK